MRKPAILIAAIAALALAGCGGDDDTTSATAPSEEVNTFTTTTPDESFAVTADKTELAFTETELSVPTGSVTVDFDNPSTTSHDVVIEDADGNEVLRTDVIQDSSAAATAKLEPGTYTFFCSVDGHRDAGMEGTLTVN